MKMDSKKDDLIINDNGECLVGCDEKTWGKEEAGENITEGYSFTGKKVFGKATEGLKNLLIKGKQKCINGTNIIVLDARKQGAGIEIDIQITDKKERGKSVVKIYDSNPKKKTITVSKSKGSDQKFVILLAEKIIKPLIKMFLAGQETNLMNEDMLENKCGKCNKKFASPTGLKAHITKIHTKKRKAEISNDGGELLNLSGASKETEYSSEIICDEINESKDNKKIYSEKCESCDFSVSADRKYTVIQHMTKHTRECKNKCEICDFNCKDGQILRKHMRDKHDVLTNSTSPPPKKSKINRSDSVESMELEEGIVEKPMDKRSEETEVMDVDIDNKSEIEERKLRSKKWDEKIENKNERQEKIDELENEKKKANEEKIHKEEIQRIKLKNKIKKSLRNKRKRDSKRKQDELDENPKIKGVPNNCKHLVKDTDVVYTVPGNGCCGPNCAAAFVYQDEKFGSELRIKMNKFQAEHWFRKYHAITPCSPQTPFVRKLNNGEVSFTEPEKLIEFLKLSKDAAFMWSDSEDLAVIADLLQIRIKIITINNIDDQNPRVNWIYPDESMREFAELKDVIKEDLILLHQNDCHFNLIISKDHALAVHGNLTKRLNQTLPSEKNINIDEGKNEIETKAIRALQEELQTIKNEYKNCVKELRNKTEEAEFLKTEVKELKEILKFKEIEGENEEETLLNMKRSGSRRTTPQFQSSPKKKEVDKHISYKHTKEEYVCEICGLKCIGQPQLNEHKQLKHLETKEISINEPEYNCVFCDFQGTELLQLNRHINLKHTAFCKICDFQVTDESEMKKHFELKHAPKGLKQANNIECRICGKLFQHRWEFMSHRKKEHIGSVAICKSNLEGNCPYSFELCWWNHEKKQPKDMDSIQCFVCGKNFKSRANVMMHRKEKHLNIVRNCVRFKERICRFTAESCWYVHKDERHETMDVDKKEEISEKENEESKLDFQKVIKKKEPPLGNL